LMFYLSAVNWEFPDANVGKSPPLRNLVWPPMKTAEK
jgi:hypothetical protein